MSEQVKQEPRIEVSAASGNVKPWQARIYIGDRFIGKTGFCATRSAAQSAAESMLAAEARHE